MPEVKNRRERGNGFQPQDDYDLKGRMQVMAKALGELTVVFPYADNKSLYGDEPSKLLLAMGSLKVALEKDSHSNRVITEFYDDYKNSLRLAYNLAEELSAQAQDESLREIKKSAGNFLDACNVVEGLFAKPKYDLRDTAASLITGFEQVNNICRDEGMPEAGALASERAVQLQLKF